MSISWEIAGEPVADVGRTRAVARSPDLATGFDRRSPEDQGDLRSSEKWHGQETGHSAEVARSGDRPQRRLGDRSQQRLQLPLLIVWSLLLFFYGIHQGDLYRTEGLRAIIGKEMYRTGDWVVPRLYGEPILTKPPMFYWAIAATGMVFGEVTTWSSRLPAALAGMAAVLIVYFTVRRYRDSLTALLCAMALPMSLLWLEKASSSEIDTLLVMWVLGAWACFLRVMECVQEPTGLSRRCLGWWIAALVCVAGGVLTKWMGFLFFYVMVIPMLAWHRQLWRLFHWHHLLAALIGVALVWCWLGAVVFELGWSNVLNMLWKEGAPRVIHGQSTSQHLWLETLVHPFKVLGLALPWSAFALFGLWRGRLATEAHPVGVPTECGTGLDVQGVVAGVSCTQLPPAIWDSAAPFAGGNGVPLTPATTMQQSRRYLGDSLWCWAILGTLMMTIFPDHNIRQSFSLIPAWTLLGALAAMRLIREHGSGSRQTSDPPLVGTLRESRYRLMLGFFLIWCVVKVVYVEIIIPARFAKRPSLAEQAKIMQEFVPTEATLYLSKVKDECLMFNYGRAVRRISAWDQLPTQGVNWCVLTEAERAVFSLPVEHEQRLLDAQGEMLVLCRVRVGTLE
ncbi:MAG: glycosyltransferase family 39 protein [Gemmatales bacterium]